MQHLVVRLDDWYLLAWMLDACTALDDSPYCLRCSFVHQGVFTSCFGTLDHRLR